MAFAAGRLTLIRDLGPVGYYHYLTEDAPATVDTAGYFNGASGQLNVGDVILVEQVDAAAAPRSVTALGHHVVTSNAGGVVDVSDAAAIATTDTD